MASLHEAEKQLEDALKVYEHGVLDRPDYEPPAEAIVQIELLASIAKALISMAGDIEDIKNRR